MPKQNQNNLILKYKNIILSIKKLCLYLICYITIYCKVVIFVAMVRFLFKIRFFEPLALVDENNNKFSCEFLICNNYKRKGENIDVNVNGFVHTIESCKIQSIKSICANDLS